MFTGIIENTGLIKEVMASGTNKIFWVASPLAKDLKVDQSLSHNGVCLTVEEIKEGMHRVTAIEETLIKTNLGSWQQGDIINLERCMQLNGRLDGHIVQGHIDCKAIYTAVLVKDGSWEYNFTFPEEFAVFIIEKGSVTVNGISLTCFNVTNNSFTVAVIPYTFVNTNMSNLKKGDAVNIEWDVVGKYVQRIMEIKN
jgi:riboflavin synthase